MRLRYFWHENGAVILRRGANAFTSVYSVFITRFTGAGLAQSVRLVTRLVSGGYVVTILGAVWVKAAGK